ncbi:MAG: IS110 family transposase [Geodermatophilaceae bacterium]
MDVLTRAVGSSHETGPPVGRDTHGRTHHGAVIDLVGRLLGDRELPATAAGYRALLTWIGSFGGVRAVGVEGTGTYGAGLAGIWPRRTCG